MSKSKGTTHAVVARVQGAVAKNNGGMVPKGNYVGRMQRAVAKTIPVVTAPNRDI